MAVNPLISLIMPCFNTEKYIEEMIISIKAQTYPNWECIIIDDHSSDNTFKITHELTEDDNRFKIFKRPETKNKGGNSCRNYGFQLSRGEYINWIDSDDVLHTNMLEEKIKLLRSKNHLDFVVSQTAQFHKVFESDKIYEYKISCSNLKSSEILTDYIIGKITFYTIGPMWRKSFLDGKILFDEEIFIIQEWEFYARLLLFNPKYESIEKPLYFRRLHDNSISGNIRLMNPDYVKKYITTRRKVYFLLKSKELLNKEINQFYLKIYYSLLISQIEMKRFYQINIVLSQFYYFIKRNKVGFLEVMKISLGLVYLFFTKRKSRFLVLNLY